MDALIGEMAQKYKDDKKIDFDAAKSELMDKMTGAESKLHGTTVRLSVIDVYLLLGGVAVLRRCGSLLLPTE